MRIAVVAPPWLPVPPVGYGGTELVLDALCRGLAAKGNAVLLCTTGESSCPVERAWTFETSRGTESISPRAELSHAIFSYAAITAWCPDLVHDHTLVGPLYGVAHRDVPVVTTNHGPFCGDLAATYRAIARRVPTIAISHDQAARAHGTAIAAVIHHGLDIHQYPVGDGRGGYALFLGRMSPDKGIHTAIVAARAAGVPLRIAAKMREPKEREFFTEVVEPLLGENVEYLGEVQGDEKLALIGDAICLLNPIAWPEPFGMVMVEALACGTPVVSTRMGAAPEIVDDGVTGYLRQDCSSLAAALADLDSLDRSACRKMAELRFSAQRMAADHIRLYESVI